MSSTTVPSETIDRILTGFRAGAHVRERLAGGGTVNLDRKLPFVVVYRQPQNRADAGTDVLVIGEACFVIARGEPSTELAELLRALAEASTAELGSFLILEVWSGAPDSARFLVHAPPGRPPASVTALLDGLAALELDDFNTTADVVQSDARQPPELPPLISPHDCWQLGALLLGLEVPPLYRDPQNGAVYPVFLRRMRAQLSRVLRQTFYEFARVQTNTAFESFQALGPRQFGAAVTDADRELADIEQSFSFLLLISPVNVNTAWQRFKQDNYARPPDFHYRLLPMDPDRLRRRLWAIDLDPVADPAMAFLLHDKREELDRQISMLAERNSPLFRYASIRLYHPVDVALLDLARDILRTVQPAARDDDVIGADYFAQRARAELDHYRAALPDLAADIQIRPDVAGLMVADGNLLIDQYLEIRAARVEPLLHHEVGTHIVTYYNGRVQPLRQLCTGLADYDEMQEGLAVFAEYLGGGLDADRMLVLAARVVAAHAVEHGADFMETFRLLHTTHGFSAGSAFDIAARVHESGGFTRDLIYLRGLARVLEYVRDGGALEPLFSGKFAFKHIDVMAELRARGFVAPSPLRPRLLDDPDASARLAAVRAGLPLTQLLASR